MEQKFVDSRGGLNAKASNPQAKSQIPEIDDAMARSYEDPLLFSIHYKGRKSAVMNGVVQSEHYAHILHVNGQDVKPCRGGQEY